MLSALRLTIPGAVTILSAFFHAVFSRGYCNEAYFSAEQPPPQAHARLPRPDADEGWTGGSFAPSPQGPQAPGGLSQLVTDAALPKEKRLAKRREVLRGYQTGRKNFFPYAVVFFARNRFPPLRV